MFKTVSSVISLVFIVLWSVAEAATVSYRFTADTASTQGDPSTGGPSSYVSQAQSFSQISGLLTYQLDPIFIGGNGSPGAFIYNGSTSILLDQFSTASLPASTMFVGNDLLVASSPAGDVFQDQFHAFGPSPTPIGPPAIFNLVGFNFFSGTNPFSSGAVPTSLTLSDFFVANIILETIVIVGDGTTQEADVSFRLTSLTPFPDVAEVPVPGAMVLFLSGLIGGGFWTSKRKKT